MKFYKRDPNAALAGMAELSLRDRGAYNSIIDLLYATDDHLPDDDRRIARMISCHWREWAAAKKALIATGKIWIEDGLIHAKRVQETLKDAARFSQEQSKRASRRWQKSENANEIKDGVMPRGNASTATATASWSTSVAQLRAPAREPGDALEILERKLREAAGWQNEPAPGLCVTGPIQALIDAGAVLELDVLPTIRAVAPKVRGKSGWKYFIGPIQDAMMNRAHAANGASPAGHELEAKREAARQRIAAHNRRQPTNA